MGLFSGAKDILKKTEAALVIQNLLLPLTNLGVFEGDAQKLSTLLVEAVWEQKPDLFGGGFGQRPHKLAVAAAAIANGIKNMKPDHPNCEVLKLCLGNLMGELAANGRLYPFNGVDEVLLEIAADVFDKCAEASAETERDTEFRDLLSGKP